jgi:hypothetical protein
MSKKARSSGEKNRGFFIAKNRFSDVLDLLRTFHGLVTIENTAFQKTIGKAGLTYQEAIGKVHLTYSHFMYLLG